MGPDFRAHGGGADAWGLLRLRLAMTQRVELPCFSWSLAMGAFAATRLSEGALG